MKRDYNYKPYALKNLGSNEIVDIEYKIINSKPIIFLCLDVSSPNNIKYNDNKDVDFSNYRKEYPKNLYGYDFNKIKNLHPTKNIHLFIINNFAARDQTQYYNKFIDLVYSIFGNDINKYDKGETVAINSKLKELIGYNFICGWCLWYSDKSYFIAPDGNNMVSFEGSKIKTLNVVTNSSDMKGNVTVAKIPIDVRNRFAKDLMKFGVNQVYSWDEALAYSEATKGLLSIPRIAVILARSESDNLFITRRKNRDIDPSKVKEYSLHIDLGDVPGGWNHGHDFNPGYPLLIEDVENLPYSVRMSAGQHRAKAHAYSNVEYMVFPIVFHATEETRLLQDKIKGRSKTDELTMFCDIPDIKSVYTINNIKAGSKLLYFLMNNLNSANYKDNIDYLKISEAITIYDEAWRALYSLVTDKKSFPIGHILKKYPYITALLFTYRKIPKKEWEYIANLFIKSSYGGDNVNYIDYLYAHDNFGKAGNAKNSMSKFTTALDVIYSIYNKRDPIVRVDELKAIQRWRIPLLTY
jgi:hypothetical protein